MRSPSNASDLIRLLDRLGVPGARPREDGRYSLSVGDDRRLDIHVLPDGGLVLEVVVAFLPESDRDRAAFIERALRFSTACMPKRHDVLCMAPASDVLLLQCGIQARAGEAALAQALENFLNASDAWKAAMYPGANAGDPGPIPVQRRASWPVLEP